MTSKALAFAACLLLATAVPSAAQAPSEENWDGLVRVRSDKIELVYLAPEADFRSYNKVMFDPAELAMRKNWVRDQRRMSSTLSGQVSERDVTRGLARGKEDLEASFAEAFAKAGYTVVTEPGPDVARIRVGVVDIDVTAPDVSASRSRTYSEEAGSATLVVEVRDSVTNTLLGRAVDQRIAGDNGSWLRTSASNRADFNELFDRWATASANGLTELKSLSPIDVNGVRAAP